MSTLSHPAERRRITLLPTLFAMAAFISAPLALAHSPGCEHTPTQSFHKLIKPGWDKVADYPNNRQKLIIASDPQPFRAMTQRSPYAERVDAKQWHANIDWVTERIRRARDASYYVPLIINGDLTDFGHRRERKLMQDKMLRARASQPGPLMFPGLGNHDYDQNVGDCANNGCARDSVCDMVMWGETLQPQANFDYRWDSRKRTHRGSLAYSVDVGRVRIVQLQMEPTYTRHFETGGGFAPNKKARFSITASMDWLERELHAAYLEKKYVIVNLHKRYHWRDDAVRDGRFRQLLERYKVVAVFAGHYHAQLGPMGSIGTVPVFQTGAMLAKSFLEVTFDWTHNTMHVASRYSGRRVWQETVVNLPALRPPAIPKLLPKA